MRAASRATEFTPAFFVRAAVCPQLGADHITGLQGGDRRKRWAFLAVRGCGYHRAWLMTAPRQWPVHDDEHDDDE